MGNMIRGNWTRIVRMWRNCGSGTVSFQITKNRREKLCIVVDSKHLARKFVHDPTTSAPESVSLGFNEEGAEGVGNLVAHVRVAHIEASEDDALHFEHTVNGFMKHLPTQHVHEHNTRRHYERYILPSLHDQRAVHSTEPGGHVRWLKLGQAVATLANKVAQTL